MSIFKYIPVLALSALVASSLYAQPSFAKDKDREGRPKLEEKQDKAAKEARKQKAAGKKKAKEKNKAAARGKQDRGRDFGLQRAAEAREKGREFGQQRAAEARNQNGRDVDPDEKTTPRRKGWFERMTDVLPGGKDKPDDAPGRNKQEDKPSPAEADDADKENDERGLLERIGDSLPKGKTAEKPEETETREEVEAEKTQSPNISIQNGPRVGRGR